MAMILLRAHSVKRWAGGCLGLTGYRVLLLVSWGQTLRANCSRRPLTLPEDRRLLPEAPLYAVLGQEGWVHPVPESPDHSSTSSQSRLESSSEAEVQRSRCTHNLLLPANICRKRIWVEDGSWIWVWGTPKNLSEMNVWKVVSLRMAWGWKTREAGLHQPGGKADGPVRAVASSRVHCVGHE